MHSSTFSFKTELKVLLVVVVVIAMADIAQRIYFRYGHADAKLLHDFPAVADELASGREARRETSMILVGNSLTQNGYDMPLLKSELQTAGYPNLHVEKVALAGSNPIEWYHIFSNCFTRRGKAPDYLVINMSPSGISDELPQGYRIGWLAIETAWSDVPEVLFKDLKDSEIGGQYLQSRLSMLYADRWDLRVGILVNLMPDVQASMKWVNAAQLAQAKEAAAKAAKTRLAAGQKAEPPRTYDLLNRLLTLARAGSTRIILVTMPARDPYDIDPALFPILQTFNVTLIDCRNLPGLTHDAQDHPSPGFEDDWHLNPQGANIFTTRMAEALPETIHPRPATTR